MLGTPPAFILSQDQTLKFNLSFCLLSHKWANLLQDRSCMFLYKLSAKFIRKQLLSCFFDAFASFGFFHLRYSIFKVLYVFICVCLPGDPSSKLSLRFFHLASRFDSSYWLTAYLVYQLTNALSTLFFHNVFYSIWANLAFVRQLSYLTLSVVTTSTLKNE